MVKVFNLQMTSAPNVEENISTVQSLLNERADEVSGNIVVLPECFAYFGGKESGSFDIVQPIGAGQLQADLANIARKFKIYLVAGSMPITGNDSKKFKNVCLVFGPTGELVLDYQKIHLFDVTVADGTKNYRESDTAEAGDRLAIFKVGELNVGIAICYDLRFPGLFQILRQDFEVDLILLPSAFTKTTGAAHWHTLVQARAIETQCYVAACNQVGRHQNGRETYGHSLIVDPWGQILSDAKLDIGLYSAELDINYLAQVRRQMPVAEHNRIDYKLK